MQRTKEEFLDQLERYVPLEGLSVVEIGCGNGSRSETIAERCLILMGIDPVATLIERARKRNFLNALFEVGSAEALSLENNSVDVVIFALSLHHVPILKMSTAIDEALRVARPTGAIIFLEPTEEGSFFEAELLFDASDGDERAEKRAAYNAILSHPGLQHTAEIDDETVFKFESVEDFRKSLEPKKNRQDIPPFLESHGFILNAKRRIHICYPK